MCFVKEDCPTCNDVMPLLETAYAGLRKRLDFFVCGQTEAGNRVLAERHGLTVPILNDASLKVSFAWDIEIVPTLYIVGADGQPGSKLVGFVREEWREAVESVASAAGVAQTACRLGGVSRMASRLRFPLRRSDCRRAATSRGREQPVARAAHRHRPTGR